MKRARLAIIGAMAVAAISAAWAMLTWNTGFGAELFVQPGGWIADLLLPVSREPFQAQSANSVPEAFGQFAVARGLERGLQAWWCAVAFWVVLVPLLTFACILAVRRH